MEGTNPVTRALELDWARRTMLSHLAHESINLALVDDAWLIIEPLIEEAIQAQERLVVEMCPKD